MAQRAEQRAQEGLVGRGRASGGSTVLLLADTQSYRVEDFAAAARRLGIGFIVGSDRCHVLAALFDEKFLIVNFDRPDEAARAIVDFTLAQRIDAIIPGGDRMAVVASLASSALGLPHNPVDAALAASDKRLLREALARGGVRSPRHAVFSIDEPAMLAGERVAAEIGFPCVVKPLRLSASRGVIRADDRGSFALAVARLAALLRTDEIRKMRDAENERYLVEEFVPGAEVAVEAIITAGSLHVLAIFDKPDPLDGPFFEETIYVTPSRLPASVQAEIAAETAAGARALELTFGSVHAELRVNERGAHIIEIAARSIGGLCSRALRFGLGASLEEIILRSALGQSVDSLERERAASGVMMIPIPRAGILKEVRGVADAERVAGIESVTITVDPGQTVVPLPDGASYLGFLFARGESPALVEQSLRDAHAALSFAIAPRATPA
jgi:biotin carboxylase